MSVFRRGRVMIGWRRRCVSPRRCCPAALCFEVRLQLIEIIAYVLLAQRAQLRAAHERAREPMHDGVQAGMDASRPNDVAGREHDLRRDLRVAPDLLERDDARTGMVVESEAIDSPVVVDEAHQGAVANSFLDDGALTTWLRCTAST
jgi:hypothetical protein